MTGPRAAMLAIVASCPPAPAGAQGEAGHSPPAVRLVVPLLEGWRFRRAGAGQADAPNAGDGAWAPVSVPHTWNRAGLYLPDAAAHLNRPSDIDKGQGVGWYRLSFTPPAGFVGARAWLQFDAASRTAEVWLNGVRLGEHRGGFSRFRLDATAALKPGQPNLLVVRTDNSPPVAGSATAGTFPLRGDFFVHGGLYRPVSLVATGRVHFDMLDHGGTGVYATTTAIRGRDATVEIRSRIRNDGDGSVAVRIVPRMTDADGKVATGTPQTVGIARNAQVEIVQSVILRDARLWQGVSDPHLYSLGVEIRSAKGQILDRVDQKYGVRQIRIDSHRRRRPDQPLAVSEYGAGGATTVHTDDVLGGPPNTRGREQPEEYQSYLHERTWAILGSRPCLWATWLWTAFDFATTIRAEGDSIDINTKGLITYDRKIKKDAYFFYRANWTDRPTVHINSSRYVDRAYQFAQVSVYSNAADTELRLNGTSAGTRSRCPGMVCTWRIKLQAGVNALSASGRFGAGEVRDDATWRLREEATTSVHIDSGALAAPERSPRRFGSDAFFEGGRAATVDVPPAAYGLQPTRREVAGADADVSRSLRVGGFAYHIPVNPGRYAVTLTFVEPDAPPGARIFDVTANGAVALSRFDIRRSAGRTLLTVKRSFQVDAASGFVDLKFSPRKGEALVGAVELSFLRPVP